MQKLLIATAVGALVLTGCATNNAKDVNVISQEMPAHDHKHGHKHGDRHGKKPHPHGVMTESYTCDQEATITAKYNPEAETALLNITAPSLSLSGAEVEGKRASSASGMLFVNDVNPASKYEWHAKGNIAVLDVTLSDGRTYTLRCEGTRPMHNHAH